MARFRLTKALSKCGTATKDILFRNNIPYDSASILAEASWTMVQNKLPEVQPLDSRVVNIGRNQCGEADVVLQIAGSWQKRSMTGGAAWIMKDDRLQTIHGSCLQTFGVSSLQMEVLACLQGIKWASTQRLHNVSIYTGSRDLVQLLQGNNLPLDIGLLWTIQEIKCHALELNWCCVHKVARSKIHHAHNAAIACRGGLLTPDSF